MVETDHPWFDRFARFSMQEAQHGLLDDDQDMLSAMQWHSKLEESGLMIRGNRLRYQEGVKRKRLPPRQDYMDPRFDKTAIPAVTANIEEPNDALHDAIPDEAIDGDCEDVVEQKENRAAELPTRSKRFGIGKEIGYAVYVHRDYESALGASVEWAKRHLPDQYDYTVVKLNQRNDSVSFIYCHDFDTAHEPSICAIVVVSADGHAQRRTTPADPFIYHHKWLFVADDYSGFNVEESKARSSQWIALGDVDRSRIGRKNYWEQQVVPRLCDQQEVDCNAVDNIVNRDEPEVEEQWVRSEEARRTLKLTTCELAHARDSGKITFKKVGNAYLYRIPHKPSTEK